MISPAGTKLESRTVHRPGHRQRGHGHCDIDTPSYDHGPLKEGLKIGLIHIHSLKFQRTNYHSLEKYSVKIFKIKLMGAGSEERKSVCGIPIKIQLDAQTKDHQ